MKFNAILLGILCLLISSNIAKANEYYCSQDTNSYNSNYIYDSSKTAEAYCGWLKDPFFSKKDPNRYVNCVKRYNELKTSFTKGICTPIYTKTYTQGSSKCIVHYFKTGAKLRETQRECYGSDIDSLKSQIDKIYK